MIEDLITRSEVLSVLKRVFGNYGISFSEKCKGFVEEVQTAINEIPVAYDVDKVVGKLEELERWNNEKFKDIPCKFGEGYGCCIDEVIEIVQPGTTYTNGG